MVDHVSITVADFARALPFYQAVMAALGVPRVYLRDDAAGFGVRNRAHDDGHTYLTVRRSDRGRILADQRHWCFRAPDRAAVDRFHAAGLAAGGRCGGPPGLRPAYHASYYAAFLLDPDGNLIEAVTHRG
jgi:catechol 2,3-dioxygenase-like lactoylglutathione lyase family enzyme